MGLGVSSESPSTRLGPEDAAASAGDSGGAGGRDRVDAGAAWREELRCVGGAVAFSSLLRFASLLSSPLRRLSRTRSSSVVLVDSLSGHEAQVQSLLAHPHLPLLISGAGDATVRVWDVETRRGLRVLRGHTSAVITLAIDPAGHLLASGSRDATVRLWDLDSGSVLHVLSGHEKPVEAVAWEASGRYLASGSLDQTILVWDAAAGERLRVHQESDWVLALAAHPTEDLFASGSLDSNVRLWRWSSAECVRTLAGHSRAVSSLAASTSFVVSGSWDASVRVWSWASGTCVRVLDDSRGLAPRGALSWCDSRLEALEEGGALHVWDTAAASDPASWSRLRAPPTSESRSECATVMASNQLACGAKNSRACIAVWTRVLR